MVLNDLQWLMYRKTLPTNQQSIFQSIYIYIYIYPCSYLSVDRCHVFIYCNLFISIFLFCFYFVSFCGCFPFSLTSFHFPSIDLTLKILTHFNPPLHFRSFLESSLIRIPIISTHLVCPPGWDWEWIKAREKQKNKNESLYC